MVWAKWSRWLSDLLWCASLWLSFLSGVGVSQCLHFFGLVSLSPSLSPTLCACLRAVPLLCLPVCFPGISHSHAMSGPTSVLRSSSGRVANVIGFCPVRSSSPGVTSTRRRGYCSSSALLPKYNGVSNFLDSRGEATGIPEMQLRYRLVNREALYPLYIRPES